MASALTPKRLYVAVTGWLLVAVGIGVFASRTWPLVNDGALLHYISFMIDSGQAPYRQLLDMDFPGAFAVDWSVVHVLGAGPVAWRVFDALLMLATSFGMISIAGPYSRFAGFVAACLFWLLHLRDGMGQAGQRDLVEAMLLLGMMAFAFRSVRRGRPRLLILAGLCAGMAVTIKPDSVVLGALVLGLSVEQHRRVNGTGQKSAVFAMTGFLLPLLATAMYLHQEHALRAFWMTLTEIIPYYASLGRQTFPDLLRDWLPAPLRVVGLATLTLVFACRREWSWEKTVLALALTWGLASFLLQGKGFLYQRYPSMAFLLLLASILCAGAVRLPGWPRVLAGAVLFYGVFVIAPASLVRTLHARWSNALLDALQSDLHEMRGSEPDDSIQCIDSIVGCNTALLRAHLHQQTGMLTDFLIFGSETVPAIRRTRLMFWNQITSRPPRVMVVTGALHPSDADLVPFSKLATWPAFEDLLRTRYSLIRERSFAPGMNGPLAYRIYLLRDEDVRASGLRR